MKGSGSSTRLGSSTSGSSLHSSPSSSCEAEPLPPLFAYGKEIFAGIFGENNEDLGYISDSTQAFAVFRFLPSFPFCRHVASSKSTFGFWPPQCSPI